MVTAIVLIVPLVLTVIIATLVLSRNRKQDAAGGTDGGAETPPLRAAGGLRNINYALHGEGDVVVNQAYIGTLPKNRSRAPSSSSSALPPLSALQQLCQQPQGQHEQQQQQHEQIHKSEEQAAVYSTVPSTTSVTAAKKGEIIYVSNCNNVYDKWGVGPTPVYSYSSKSGGGGNAPPTEYSVVPTDEGAEQRSGPMPSHDNYAGYDISAPKAAIVYAVPMADDDDDGASVSYAIPVVDASPTYATAATAAATTSSTGRSSYC